MAKNFWDLSPDNMAPESDLLAPVAQEKKSSTFHYMFIESDVKVVLHEKHYFVRVNILQYILKLSRKQYIHTMP